MFVKLLSFIFRCLVAFGCQQRFAKSITGCQYTTAFKVRWRLKQYSTLWQCFYKVVHFPGRIRSGLSICLYVQCWYTCTRYLPLKVVFHFNRIILKSSVFLGFLSGSVELMTSTQKKMLRYVTITIRLKWKTDRSLCWLISWLNNIMSSEHHYLKFKSDYEDWTSLLCRHRL